LTKFSPLFRYLQDFHLFLYPICYLVLFKSQFDYLLDLLDLLDLFFSIFLDSDINSFTIFLSFKGGFNIEIYS